MRCGFDRDFHILRRCAGEGSSPQGESVGVNRAGRVSGETRAGKGNAIVKPCAAYRKHIISSGLTRLDRRGVRGVRHGRQYKVPCVHCNSIPAELDYVGASRGVISDHQLSGSESAPSG